MIHIHKKPDISEKLSVLSQDSQFDLACACGRKDLKEDHRHRSKEDKWIYPVVLPDNRRTFLFKTLISNVCVNDCRYCPLRSNQDTRRFSLQAEELVNTFFKYYNIGRVSGLFLSSGVIGNPDLTMERINKIAILLRRMEFKGYLHLKIIPGASDAAIEEALSLASAVSINIETPGQKNFAHLGTSKDYIEDIIRPIKLISNLTGRGAPYGRVKQTTQFVVGASSETDQEIVKYSWGLYKRLGLNRVYFSAYQRGMGDNNLPGELSHRTNNELLTREHRLYQVDWLLRKYSFNDDEIPFDNDGNLLLSTDPKEVWAELHPEFFPLDINRADKFELLRVPGFGSVTVDEIIRFRKDRRRIRSIEDLGKPGKRLRKAEKYLKFGY
ncbi:MAG: radical SAM protein [Spirochaetota bacterium]|nr:radical SAM protein [Spirochaetota bacterium]